MAHLMTTAQAAQELGVSLRTLGRIVASGQLEPHMKLPGATGARLFDSHDVARIKNQRTDDGGQAA